MMKGLSINSHILPLIPLDKRIQLIPPPIHRLKSSFAFRDRTHQDLGPFLCQGDVGHGCECGVDFLGGAAPGQIVGAAEDDYPVEEGGARRVDVDRGVGGI